MPHQMIATRLLIAALCLMLAACSSETELAAFEITALEAAEPTPIPAVIEQAEPTLGTSGPSSCRVEIFFTAS